MALAINTRTGVTVSVPDHYIGHSVLGKNLALATDEVQAAPKKETKKKEQPAPVVEVVEVLPEPEINIEENEDIEDGN
jgi:hypothetical protein